MKRRAALATLGALPFALAAPRAHAGGQVYEALALSVREALRSHVMDPARRPSPLHFESGADAAYEWQAEMNRRLRPRIADRKHRDAFLKTLHHEARRRGHDPQLVLALIEVESGFRQHAVSIAGARGYMQVMPFWIGLIGDRSHNLFDMLTNLRYGCVILRHYLDIEKGELFFALGRYNGSRGREEYPRAVIAHWKSGRWAYAGPTS